jgi:hypothetical protein
MGIIFAAYNIWKSHNKDKVQLKLTPKIYKIVGNGRLCSSRIPDDDSEIWNGICVEIINVGFIAVTIDHVGLKLVENGVEKIVAFPDAEISGNDKLPKRLEPRTSVNYFIPSKMPHLMFKEGLPHAKHFYATTACGITVKGNSKVTKWLIKMAQ